VPLEAERIREVLDLEDAPAARGLVEELIARYEAEPRGLAIVEVGGGYRMVTRPELAPWLVRLARARTRVSACRVRRWRRWPSSRTSSRSRVPSSTLCAASTPMRCSNNLLERRLIRVGGRKERLAARSSTRPRGSSSSPSAA